MVQRECCRINYSWFTFEINTASFCYANEKEGDGRGSWRFEPLDAIFSTQKQLTFLSAFLSSLLRFLWRERLQIFKGFKCVCRGLVLIIESFVKILFPSNNTHAPCCCHIIRDAATFSVALCVCFLLLLRTASEHSDLWRKDARNPKAYYPLFFDKIDYCRSREKFKCRYFNN